MVLDWLSRHACARLLPSGLPLRAAHVMNNDALLPRRPQGAGSVGCRPTDASSPIPGRYARGQLAARGAVAKLRYGA